YSDFYVLFDNTPSMGIAATSADITRLQNLTGGCAFACHETDLANNNYTIAHNAVPPITLRVDSVRNAVASLLTAIQTNQTTLNNFRAGIYSFGATAQTAGLTLVAPLSSSMPTVTTAANQIDLMTTPNPNYNSDQQTDFNSIWGSLNANVADSGDGSTLALSRKYVFFVSDGVNDGSLAACNKPKAGGNRCQQPIDPALCQMLKTRGITIVSIYTTYLPIYGNGWYDSYVKPYNSGPWSPSPNSEIATNMKACASTGFYQEVGPDDSLASVMNTMFQRILATPRIQS
ncbi:MAG: pilus assembly protein, partial [Pseudomonadota bacterium]|nr:pilus assembly protein [Pseudomonadota bacterium]